MSQDSASQWLFLCLCRCMRPTIVHVLVPMVAPAVALVHVPIEHSHNRKHKRNHRSAFLVVLICSSFGGLHCSIPASWLGPPWCLGMLRD